MDWLWPIYQEYLMRLVDHTTDQGVIQQAFIKTLAESTATLYAMEPVKDTIRFKGLGRWPLPKMQQLLSDPHAFIADQFGGGKFKVNFHHHLTFVGTHNFRTYGEEKWQTMDEINLD
ncbi:MAG TPA: hypothetical protein EYN66_21715 [Myxococcales bacterium]|nr:hypothetical protein [Myxococcales bacterium]